MNRFIQISCVLATVAAVASTESTRTGDRSRKRTLSERWAIPEPSLEFQRGDSVVVLKYDTRDGNNIENDKNENENSGSFIVSSSVSLWSKECQSGGGTELKPLDDDDDDDSNNALIVERRPDDFSVAAVGIDLYRLWSDFSENIIFDGDETISAGTATAARSIVFCVRSALSSSKKNDETEAIEVNFVESVVTATIKMVATQNGEAADGSSAFLSLEWITATVAPFRFPNGHRHEYTFYQSLDDTIGAFLCEPGGGDSKNGPVDALFSQGSILTLCVQPSSKHYETIRVASIEDFTWTKVPLLSHGKGDSIMESQEAIKDGKVDMLTSYNGCGDSFCTLSTLLVPAFYTKTKGLVTGTGTVTLEFGRTKTVTVNSMNKTKGMIIRKRADEKNSALQMTM